MRIERNGTVWCGRAIDLSAASLDAGVVIRAIRNGTESTSNGELTVERADPGTIHEHVGWITHGMSLRLRAALAAVARSRGQSAPQDMERKRILERIDALPTATVETVPTRKRLAATNEEIDRQREQVARLQGQVQALRKIESEDLPEAIGALERAIRELSELETERAAAEQALERKRNRRRQLHDIRDERLALEDRAANLARDAREHLAARIEAEFEDTITTVPGTTAPGAADHVTAGLAIARLGVIEAPIVLECDRFTNARAAADWLDAPVVCL